MTLEDLIRDGLDVEALPPGTAVILHARRELRLQEVAELVSQVATLADHLGVKIGVVGHDFDVVPVPARHATVNGTPPQEEIRR